MSGFRNVTGGVQYPSGYWLAAPAGSSLVGIPRDFQERAGADWLAWVEAERERWYASLPSGAPPEWNARGMVSALASRAGGAWSGSASSVQSLVSTELAEYWTEHAPRLNRAEYVAREWAALEAEREHYEWQEREAAAEWAPVPGYTEPF